MSANRFSIQTTLATAAAAVVLSAAQFTGIASLATPRATAPAETSTAQLPLVVVTGARFEAFAEPMQLPTVVVTGRAERATAAAGPTTEAAAI